MSERQRPTRTVFVTGASGYLGRAICNALLANGHEVRALARSPAAAQALGAAGHTPVAGALTDLDLLREQAERADASIHAAFDYATDGVARDAAAVGALLEGARAAGQPRTVVFTSGVWGIGDTGETPFDETMPLPETAPRQVAWRAAHEREVLEAATPQLATAVVRPGIVYGGRGGLTAPLFSSAMREGAAIYVGDGANHWSLVQRDDLGALYRLIVEQRGCGVFHGVDGQPLTVAEIARAASEAAGRRGATRARPLDEARAELGRTADALCLDQRVLGPRARALGWTPAHPSFLSAAAEAFREWSA